MTNNTNTQTPIENENGNNESGAGSSLTVKTVLVGAGVVLGAIAVVAWKAFIDRDGGTD